MLRRDQLALRKQAQQASLGPPRDTVALMDELLERWVIYRCVTGSQAYGLADEASDVDVRGVFVAPPELLWSLQGAPSYLERDRMAEAYWELAKFCVLALKANPNVLECLYTPLVQHVSPIGEEFLALRDDFLSRLVHQTYNGYVLSQFKKLERDLRTKGEPKWKHVMHLIRLLLSGIGVLGTGTVSVDVAEHRDRLLAIKRGEISWTEVETWRLELHGAFDAALAHSPLPELPNYERVDPLRGGRTPPDGRRRTPVNVDPRLGAIAAAQPYPLVFATVSGAHLYGFESADSDVDLRGVHVLPVREVIGLDRGPETLQVSELRDGLDLDLVTHDVGKFCSLLLRHNGYVLEQLYSPLVVSGGALHEELKAIGNGCITRNHAHHYLGFSETQWRLYDKTHQLKPLLYTFRVLKTGIHLMRTGRVEANLLHLLDDEPRIAYLGELISDKQTHGENASVTGERGAEFGTDVARLREILAAKSSASRLPEATAARPELHDFVVRVRLATS